jgi:hypothetical protein
MGVLVLLTITQIIRIGSSRDNLLVLMRQNEGIKQRIPCFIEGEDQRIPRLKGEDKESLVLLMGKDKESLIIYSWK